MRRTIASLVILLLLVSTMAVAVPVGDPNDEYDFAGDPLDSNDWEMSVDSFAEEGCALAERWPHCVPCWNSCIFAIMADAAFGGDHNWDW